MTDQDMNVNPKRMRQPESNTLKSNGFILQRFWNRLTSPSSALKDIGERRSARLASSFLFSITVLDFIGGLARIARVGLVEAFVGPIGYSLVALLLTYLISRTRWYRAAIFLFSLSFSALAYTSILGQGNQADFGALILIYVPLSLIVASSFVSAPAVFLLVGLNIGAYLSIQAFGVSLPENIGAQAGIITVIGVVLMLLTNFRNNTEKIRLEELQKINQELESLSGELEQRVEARTQDLLAANQQTTRRSEQLTAIAELARSLTDIQDLESLLPAITTFVSQRLDYYHVGIFLNDDNQTYAILRAANSEGGQKMLARGHRLRIGEEGIVGYAIKMGKPRIALDVGTDSVYFDNPDLPETHSEMALPLRLGSEYIGALDIQSTESNAFSTEDMPVFTTLADQIAVAIQNARLINQAQIALREVEDAYAEQTGQAWQSFMKSQPISGYHYDGAEPKPLASNGKTKFDAGLTLPIRLRGRAIGKLKLKTTNQDRTWSDDEIALAEAAVERAALALESARLLEDAQKRAAREFTIGEITTNIGASTDMDAILRTAVSELGRQISGAKIAVELNPEIEQEEL
jgi:GAF domain-containing protein